jgi:hypothetical protein
MREVRTNISVSSLMIGRLTAKTQLLSTWLIVFDRPF